MQLQNCIYTCFIDAGLQLKVLVLKTFYYGTNHFGNKYFSVVIHDRAVACVQPALLPDLTTYRPSAISTVNDKSILERRPR